MRVVRPGKTFLHRMFNSSIHLLCCLFWSVLQFQYGPCTVPEEKMRWQTQFRGITGSSVRTVSSRSGIMVPSPMGTPGILVWCRPDWTSPAWSQSFKNCIRQDLRPPLRRYTKEWQQSLFRFLKMIQRYSITRVKWTLSLFVEFWTVRG